MAEHWTPTEAGRHLRGRRRRDTAPEVSLRRALRAAGAGYRVQVRLERGLSADLAFIRARLAVYIDGCFWHGCPDHGRRTFSGPNADRWAEKIARNIARDERATNLWRMRGWSVVRLRECEINQDPAASARLVVAMRDARLRELRQRGLSKGPA